MIKGLDIFKRYFAGMSDSFILIGGAACDLQFSRLAVDFRMTRDLDIVLCVESLSPDFARAFWTFVTAGQYQMQEKSDGTKRFYRFRHPVSPDFPRNDRAVFTTPRCYCPMVGFASHAIAYAR